MSRSRTTILLAGDADVILRNTVEDLELLAAVDLSPRPEVRLGLDREGPVTAAVIAARDVRGLFDLAGAHRNAAIEAFSLAAPADLELLDGATFQSEGRWVRVTRAPGRAELDDAYARRRVRLELDTCSLSPNRDRGRPTRIVPYSSAGALPRLYVRPLEISAPHASLHNLLEVTRGATGAWIMTPPADDSGGGYFTARRLALRTAVRRAVGADHRRPDEPLAFEAWRALDDPSLRDVLRDGAAIVPRTTARRTGWCLRLPGLDGLDLAARDRVAGLLRPELIEPADRRVLFEALRADVELAAGGPVSSTPGARVDWSVPELPPADFAAFAAPGPLDLGPGHSWPRFCELHRKLEPMTAANLFALAVIVPASPIAKRRPDNALAEAEFIRHVFASPEHGPRGDPIWRAAMLRLLDDDLAGRSLSFAERVEKESAVLPIDGRGSKVRYGRVDASTLARLTLTFPRGTELEPRGVFRLGASRIAGGDKLGEEGRR